MTTTSDTMQSLLKMLTAPKPKYQVVAVTDLRSGAKSFKLYRRGTAGRLPPVAIGFSTREEAEARGRELEAETKS